MLHIVDPKNRLNIHENQMGICLDENDMELSIEILHYIPDNVIHFPQTKSCIKLHLHKILFAQILISFQILFLVAKSIQLCIHQSEDNL